ncbi:hypothetical protein FA10DRAFT_263163 [Acaromyces ingoldii]|uniref:Xylanolytic transcriptional activator regulatory domain-containing protein n=1 Tax=Acaromyces ingoldii TaxID=215250 RepID=A0A316YFW7_9BASI|nr:hypothetical protein FA10DRAFT_263163 [Acaromyces ingoldii]PWN86635.1 hypothetical protein FA10DRAFT_263163 [Acaromyces ingoldii]
MWRQHSARYLRQGDRQQLHKSPTEAHETDEEERDWLQARVDEATTQLEEFISGRQKKKKQDFKDKTNNKGGTIGQGTTQTLPVSFTSPSTSKSTDLPRKSKGGKYASERYLGPVGRMDSLEVLVDPFPSSETEEDATAYDNEGRKGQVESKGKGREKSSQQIGNEECVTSRLLEHGLLSWTNICGIFDTFYERYAQHFLILDRSFHTPALVASRSAFLLAVVWAVGSRNMANHEKPEISAKCCVEAERLAAQCFSQGTKSVEIVQGLLLFAMWMPDSKHWNDDRSWVYSGLAMRIATDLGISQQHEGAFEDVINNFKNIAHDTKLEIFNRQRTWLCCYIVNKSFSALMGKQDMLQDDDLIIHCRRWCLVAIHGGEDDERLNRPWNTAIAALVDLLRMLCRQLKHLRTWNLRRSAAPAFKHRLQKTKAATTKTTAKSIHATVDHEAKMACIRTFNEELDEWNKHWASRMLFELPKRCQSRKLDHDSRLLLSLHRQWSPRISYARLLVNSFGLQYHLNLPRRKGKVSINEGIFFAACWLSAHDVMYGTTGGMRASLPWVPDAQLIMVTYASPFLFKLACNQAKLAEHHDKEGALALVQEVADTLKSTAMVNITNAALYANLLQSLLNPPSQSLD